MKAQPVTRVVYISTAVAPFSEAELTSLVKNASRNNRERGITGMLSYNAGEILQVLEGPEGAVDALLKKINADPRHTMVQTLFRGQSDSRQFSDCSMGLCDTRFEVSYCRTEFSTIAAFLDQCDTLDTDTVTMGLLNYFRRLSAGNAA